MDPMMLAGLGGGLLSAFGAMQQRKQMQEYHRKSLEQAEGGLLRARDQAENINPVANSNAAISHISDAQSQAMSQAANVGAGQAASSGLGGDVSSAHLSSIKAAQPIGTVAAQFGAQKAQVQQNLVGEELQKANTLGSLNTQLADTAKNSNITFQNKPTLLQAVTGALGGVNAGVSAYEMLRGKKLPSDNTADNGKTPPVDQNFA